MASNFTSILHVLLLGMLIILIITGNLLVIIAYKTNQRLRTATYRFLVSLAVSDFLVGSVSLPLWTYYLKYYPENGMDGNLKIFYACFDIFSAMASIFHLTAVTLERWVAICKPFYYNTLTKRSYHTAILMAWLMALVVAALWPGYYIQSEDRTGYKVYTVVIFLVGLVIPAILITFVNLRIFQVVKSIVKSSRQQLEQTSDHHVIQRNISKDKKTAITLILITSLFCLSWTPFFLTNLIPVYCLKCYKPLLENFAFVASVKWLHYSSSAYNPLVYAFRDHEMRNTFSRLFKRCCQTLKIGKKTVAEEDLSLNTDFISRANKKQTIGRGKTMTTDLSSSPRM